MKLIDLLILVIVFLIVFLIVFFNIRSYKNNNSHCSKCPYSKDCCKKDKDKNNCK